MQWLILLAALCLIGCGTANGKRYLMITTDKGPPFTTYTEYENEKEMEKAQMYIWRNGYGAKEITRKEYKRGKRHNN